MQELTFDEIELVSGGQPVGGLSWQSILSAIGELIWGRKAQVIGDLVGHIVDNWDQVVEYTTTAWNWVCTQVSNFWNWLTGGNPSPDGK